MTVPPLLLEIRESGLTIRADRGRVVLRPADRLNPVLKQWITYVKAELIHVLDGDYTRAGLELLLREVANAKTRLDLARDFDARVFSAVDLDGIGRGDATRNAYRILASRVDALPENERRTLTPASAGRIEP